MAEEQVHVRGTEEYGAKVAEFKLSPQEAANSLRAFRAEKHLGYSGEDLYVIVGDWYVFSYIEKTGIALRGYYVNGYTGEVRRRDERRVVYVSDWPEPSGLRTDCDAEE